MFGELNPRSTLFVQETQKLHFDESTEPEAYHVLLDVYHPLLLDAKFNESLALVDDLVGI